MKKLILIASLFICTNVWSDAEEPFVVEYYYKAKWGFFEEFYDLYRKNHYPILKRLQDLGRISEMNAVFPVNHAGEVDR